MQIKLRTILAGPDYSYQPGKILAAGIDISQEEAEDLLAGGFAEEVQADPLPPEESPGDTGAKTDAPPPKKPAGKGGKGA